VVNFENTEFAFAHKTNGALKQASFLFSTLGNPKLTKIGVALTNFAFKIRLPIEGIIKKTLYQQFVGGETLEEASNSAKKIFEHGVGVILDYGVEGKTTEEEFDKSAKEFIEAIEFAAGKKHIPFVSIKVTGFARFELLEKLDAGALLNNDETAEFDKVRNRLKLICDAASKANVMILIDAEETWIQDPVDSLALEMMAIYNAQQILIFNTYQMYRHDRLEFLYLTHEKSKTSKFILGAKLVRGAYMEKEQARAEEKNYPNPIQPSKEQCDKDYDMAVNYCLENNDNIAVFIGTHNDLSCLKACEIMQIKNIPNYNKHVYFSQLYGMSDNISFNLAHSGYNISKYLPYGPVKDVVPYLMRRAQENTSVAGQTGRELKLINTELKRRKLN
jgi:proline dehydrogenase